MKILHTADWHIGQFKGPVVDGVNLRSQDTVKCLEYMVQVAIEEKPDIVCVSGDIFHQEQVGPVRYSDEMITATNIITSLAHFSKYVIVMRGTPNHDGAAQFRVLERMLLNIRNVDVVTEPGVIKTPWADIACLPGFDKQEFRAKFPGLSADEENLAWTKYISDMVFALRAECEKTPILMAHYTVPGCNMESGQTSFFTNFEPVIPREALMAARYEAVLLGHIHRPQIIEGLDKVFYSGAINAMNFNDEGQDRGFWIHEFNEKGTLVKGYKCTTPYRQFHTITWDPDEVGDYIREGAMYLHRTGISEDVTDKIVRVRYSCTSEQKKALNIPLLQKNLYELGAFYVADIEAESTIDITNRGLLSEESDPRLNLKKWLEEKTFKNPDKIVELAEPIIAEAMKQSTTAEIHGVFKPVSISVRNYRNYKEENFDFSDISFCTINGVNGAGKSSLFMDAIVDCLFEETREGDCKAWIRGTEDPEADGVELNGKKIMEAISHVIYAAADGGANTQMTGIYFEGTDSGVSLAALDGHMVAVDSVKAEGAKDMKLIVPKATAKKLISMGVIDDVTLTYTKNSAVFKSDEYTIYTRLIEGKYFAYQKMFTEGEINTCASRTALIGAMTRAKMCTEEKQPAVFQIEDDVLNISIRDKLADYQEQVPLQETVCKSIRLGFDSRLVLETLKAFTCDNIALGFTSPRTPMIVEAEDSDMKAMVLPVAIVKA